MGCDLLSYTPSFPNSNCVRCNMKPASEGRGGPKRSSSIALGDVHPPDRRCLVAARLNALQEVPKVGLQVLRVLCRCHTVDTGSTILAGEPVGLPHPFQVEDVVQSGQCHPAFRSC